jgi:hypothetical protein
MSARLPLIAAVAFAGGALLSACASTSNAPATANSATADATSPSGKSCFFRSQVNGFQHTRRNERGSDSIIVTVGANRKYLFETLGPCPDIDWTETVGFDQFGPGQICDGLDVTLVVPSTIGPRRCPVRMIRQISAEEAKAY